MKLSKFYNCKRLKIVTPDDKTFTGTMVDYFSGYEEDGVPESITIRPEFGTIAGKLVEFEEKDIKSIEILDEE